MLLRDYTAAFIRITMVVLLDGSEMVMVLIFACFVASLIDALDASFAFLFFMALCKLAGELI